MKESHHKTNKREYAGTDPEGRSYYFSTFRKNNFDPDHWKSTLPK